MDHGAVARTGSLLAAISHQANLTVVSGVGPLHDLSAIPEGVRFIPVELPAVSMHRRLRFSPYEAELARVVLASAQRFALVPPDVVFWENSAVGYLGTRRRVAFPHSLNSVEFANRETKRYLAQARGGGLARRVSLVVEALKAGLWEPQVARRADLAVALSMDESTWLDGMGANVALVPNGMNTTTTSSSLPESRRVLAVGSWSYEPNRLGLERFLTDDWPRVIAEEPSAVLRVVGNGGELVVGSLSAAGVQVAGFVADLEAEYAAAAVCLAPAQLGAGSQLKIAGAVSHGRVTIGPAYLQRELATGYPPSSVVPSLDPAATIVELLRDSRLRHIGEVAARDYAQSHSWQNHAQTLIDRWQSEIDAREISQR